MSANCQFWSIFGGYVIREHLDSGTKTHELPSHYSHDVEYQHTPFTSFEPVTTEHLLSILTNALQSHLTLTPCQHPFC